jgi:phage terminase large subunit-like protein
VQQPWLPNPPSGTHCCGGFDGSETDDWTVIKLVTFDGLLFTPRFGPDQRPTIWNPAEHGGQIPRGQVAVAWSELARRYRLKRVYCDPPGWRTEIGEWAAEHGDEVFLEWPTYKAARMHPALTTFLTDLNTGAIRHDGCPITTAHMLNARKKPLRNDTYLLQKPAGATHQKIDAAVTSVIAVEAAGDAHRAGWTTTATTGLTRVTGRTSVY